MATNTHDETGNVIFRIEEGEATHQSPHEEDDSGGANLQSMNGFMEEQAEKDKRLAAQVHQNQAKKKTKPAPDTNDTAAEEAIKNEVGTTNWVGLLIEYRNAHRLAGNEQGIDFIETGNHDLYRPKFSCEVTIAETQESFGDVLLPTKKLAKQYAAKKAIDWLQANEHMPSNGSVKFPRQQSPNVTPQRTVRDPSAPPSDSDGSESPPATPWKTQVPPLCHKLGITPPQYEITSTPPGSPFYDIYADFSKDHTVQGKVGLVKNTYGKNNAKEKCARLVVLFLRDIERQRLAQISKQDQNRKRPLTSSESENE